MLNFIIIIIIQLWFCYSEATVQCPLQEQVDYLCRQKRKESVAEWKGWTNLLSLRMLFPRSRTHCQIRVGKFDHTYNLGRQYWRPFHPVCFTSSKFIMKGLSSLAITPFTQASFSSEIPAKGCHTQWLCPVDNINLKNTVMTPGLPFFYKYL